MLLKLVQTTHIGYSLPVFPGGGLIRAVVSLATCLLAVTSAEAQSKAIRLRAAPISTSAPAPAPVPAPHPPRLPGFLPAAAAPSAKANAAARELHLLQLQTPCTPAIREELRALGVTLGPYVPDDTFIVRLASANPDVLRALPYVRWLGAYQPTHRLHPALLAPPPAPAPAGPGAAAEPEVAALIAPDAAPAEITQARGLWREVRAESRHRFGIVLRGPIPAERLAEAAGSPAILWLEPAAPPILADQSASAIVGGPSTNGVTFTQALGYDGSGVVVAVADSGLDNGQLVNHTELTGRTRALFAYGGLTSAADEHSHGTHVAGIVAGRGITGEGDENGFYGLGVASGAQLIAQRVFDAAGVFRAPASYAQLVQDAVRNGALIGNNSWGNDAQGRYDLAAAQFDDLTRDGDAGTPGDQPYLLVFSAGNAGPGPQTISSPGVAKNVIATGASQSTRTNFFNYAEGPGAIANFSSRGPCEDGRNKPDLVAPGTWIASLLSSVGNIENAWAPINNEFAFMGGTSQSAAHVAGAAAIFIQWYRAQNNDATPSPALIKAALINAATRLSGPSAALPNPDEGWGRANVAALVRPAATIEYADQLTPLAAGQVHVRTLVISRTNSPLRITMAYTDYPGFPAAVPALVNNLDLELVGPDGRVYRGNQMDRGESVPGAIARDALNTVEGICLNRPAPGEYLLRIKAQNVVQDSREDVPGIQQDFALVISGGLPARGEGALLLDRSAYRTPGPVRIKLFDSDLAGAGSVTVTARSQTEPNGPTITLRPESATGAFTGSVATATGPAIADAALQIAHGDWIRIEYVDASAQSIRSAQAVADLAPPVISAVVTTNAFAQLLVAFATDEPASAIVRYGLAPDSLTRGVTNNALTTTHALELPGLTPGQTYQFLVVATDAAGNTATNNNAGALFTVTTEVPRTVLIVDAYQADPLDTAIPIEAYTAPLTEIGVGFDVWDVASQGPPAEVTALRPYPIVIWRINDSFRRPNDAIAPAQQQAIRQYLDSGGSLLIASMNLLTRLLNQGSGDFVTNVLHVRRFVLNPNSFEHCANCDEDFRVPAALGVSNDPIGQGLDFLPNYSAYDPDDLMGPDFSDTFTAATNATPFLVEATSGKTCGLRFPRTGQDSPGRVVFASLPLDAIPDSGLPPNNRRDFLRRAIQFLAPGTGGIGTISLSQPSYTIPDVVTVEMADADLEGQRTATVLVHSSSQPNHLAITLAETARPGLFRGSVPIASPTAGPLPAGSLAVADGDRIEAEYYDASTGLQVEAYGVIDAEPPAITGLVVQPGFTEALITWSTSKPTDALVQFGESSFLGRTEYRSDLRTNHALRLIGLLSGRAYYFKIAARDAAGNVASSDNSGQLHSFETQPPLPPPFVEEAEGSVSDWAVINIDDSQRGWAVGSPNDGHTAQPCPTCVGNKAWASNLYGNSADIIDTYLVSPAIDLRGANVAELRFQHDYNFEDRTGFDLISRGSLLISTNVQTDLLPLAEYTGFIFDWQEEVLDLTPYAGKVIVLVWHHELRSASPEPPVERPGWVIDHIRVTANNVPAATLRVTNNLSQARFSIRRGGLVQTAQGTEAVFTNLPPGTYTTLFDNVPFYSPPGPRTNNLASGASLTVGGAYSFADANTNGISDAWELAQFGSVSPGRTRSTDTDGDGFPDRAEFVAGTNPNQANSRLQLAPPFRLSGTLLRFSWGSVPGRSYQLQGTTAQGTWIPMSSWIRAATDLTTIITPPPGPGDPHLFRVEVQP